MMTPTTAAVILSLLASSAVAGPIVSPLYPRQAATCNAHPSGASSAGPIATPSAATAEACLQQCQANGQCQSFVFGLPSGASAPQCRLFAVEGAQVPAQDSNLMVFDKGCSGVPTKAPTPSNPVGANNGKPQKRQGQQGGNPASSNGSGNQNPGSSNSNSNSNNNNNNNNNGNSNTGSTDRVCGAAPSGPSTNSPSPMKTDTSITTQAACLQLCQQTSGCKSCEFGLPNSSGSDQCKLFSVAASQLPPNGSGATFVAYDSGC